MAEIQAAVAEGRAAGHRLLAVMDEAPEIRRPLFTALEGAMQGPMAFQLMTGNPTRASGFIDPGAAVPNRHGEVKKPVNRCNKDIVARRV